MEGLSIRRLLPGDEPLALAPSHLFDRPVDPHGLRAILADPRSYLLFAMLRGHPVGFVRAYELPQLKSARPMMLLYEIGVQAESRRRGIASALIGALREVCLQRGLEKMFVITEESNPGALALYLATGAIRPALDDVVLVYKFE